MLDTIGEFKINAVSVEDITKAAEDAEKSLQILKEAGEDAYIMGTIVVFVVRMAAVYMNWRLPSYRPLADIVHPDDSHNNHHP